MEENIIQRVLRQSGISSDQKIYKGAVIECWKCRKEIPVFHWEGREVWSRVEPKKPYPFTIKRLYSKTIDGYYWANSCPFCRAIQGDFYLYCEPDGPFFGED